MITFLAIAGAIAVLVVLSCGLHLAPYMPPRDGDLDTFVTNFSTLITAGPGTYGLVTADATAIAAVVATWHTDYLAATNGSTRGPMSIQAKNAAKASMLPVIRSYAQQIANNAGVSTPSKTALGLNTRTNTPTPIPPPSTSPVVTVIAGTPLQHTMRFADQNTPDSRSRPFGVSSLQLYGKASATAITDPNQLTFLGNFSRNPMAIDFDPADVGKQVYYCAKWVNFRGDEGPWSNIVQFTAGNGS